MVIFTLKKSPQFKTKKVTDVIKFICSGKIPGLNWLRYVCHANPNRLLALAEKSRTENPDQLQVLAREFSAILHDVRVGGVWKRTSPGRLPLTVNFLVDHLQNSEGKGVVLDLGASDGSTSADLCKALKLGCKRNFQVHMADLYLWLKIWKGSFLTEYRSTSNDPVMVRLGWFGMRLPTSEHWWDAPGNFLAKAYLSLKRLRNAMVETGQIPMINPLAMAEPLITPFELNALEMNADMVDQYDAVRASNILNLDYFSSQQLHLIIGYLHKYLRQEGVLVVSRNDGGKVNEDENGAIWLRTEIGFSRQENFGRGSEICEIVDDFKVDVPCVV